MNATLRLKSRYGHQHWEGMMARLMGKPKETNPYDPNLNLNSYLAWNLGWENR